jgi:hypothetical protein
MGYPVCECWCRYRNGGIWWNMALLSNTDGLLREDIYIFLCSYKNLQEIKESPVREGKEGSGLVLCSPSSSHI